MPLPTLPRWHMHDVREPKQLYVATTGDTKKLNLVTTALINYTMLIGVSEISHDNVDDVSCRIAVLEAVFGPILRAGGRNVFITRGDVARHVGLRTEAPQKELHTFWKEMSNFNRQHSTEGLREANGGSTALFALYERPMDSSR